VNRAVVRKRASRLKRERKSPAGRDGAGIPAASIRSRGVSDRIGVRPRHRGPGRNLESIRHERLIPQNFRALRDADRR